MIAGPLVLLRWGASTTFSTARPSVPRRPSLSAVSISSSSRCRSSAPGCGPRAIRCRGSSRCSRWACFSRSSRRARSALSRRPSGCAIAHRWRPPQAWSRRPAGLRAAGATALLVAAGLVKSLLPLIPQPLVLAVIAAVALLWLRRALHLGLLQESREISVERDDPLPQLRPRDARARLLRAVRHLAARGALGAQVGQVRCTGQGRLMAFPSAPPPPAPPSKSPTLVIALFVGGMLALAVIAIAFVLFNAPKPPPTECEPAKPCAPQASLPPVNGSPSPGLTAAPTIAPPTAGTRHDRDAVRARADAGQQLADRRVGRGVAERGAQLFVRIRPESLVARDLDRRRRGLLLGPLRRAAGHQGRAGDDLTRGTDREAARVHRRLHARPGEGHGQLRRAARAQHRLRRGEGDVWSGDAFKRRNAGRAGRRDDPGRDRRPADRRGADRLGSPDGESVATPTNTRPRHGRLFAQDLRLEHQ